jgi:HEPN/RES N-terminal domain 1
MREGFEMEWSHPEDEAVAWDSEDGCYVVAISDSYDLIDRYVALESDQLRDDLANQLGDSEWCQRNS